VSTALGRRNAAARTGRSFDPAGVRAVHLGLGAFHRAHQAWYTDVVDADNEWGIRAFTGRSAQAADDLRAQDGLYTVIQRSATHDSHTIVDAIVDAVDGARVDVLARSIAAPETALVTLTITEAGYAVDADHRPDLTQDAVAADAAWLRARLGSADPLADGAPRTALARLLVGLEARRRADAGPIAIVSCDNLPGNGELTRSALLAFAESAGANDTHAFLAEHVSFVTTSIDRITPRTTPEDIAGLEAATGWSDRAPVVTEPFHDWILSGAFPAGRPAWERAGARFVGDIGPFEQRKLLLLNGAHSLLAYAGLARGHSTVTAAMADPTIRNWVEELWEEAARLLPAAGLDLDAYRAALRERFDNGRIQHLLAQIGQDGTTKLRVRTAPVLLAERAAGRDGEASIRLLGAWAALAVAGRLPADGADAKLRAAVDERAPIRALLRVIDGRLAEEAEIVTAVSRAAATFAA